MDEQIKILLVDDEEPSREALLLLLKGAGYRLTGCGSGSEALEFLATDSFDLVITDLFLPDLTGIDILKKVKELSAVMEVILITGHASAESAVRAMKEWITRPSELVRPSSVTSNGLAAIVPVDRTGQAPADAASRVRRVNRMSYPNPRIALRSTSQGAR